MSSTSPAHEKNQLKTLQIVRALASTSVVYHHIGAAPCFGGQSYLPCFGGFGVDMFFVLSGFVMAMVVATGQAGTRFAINRVSRIVPLYWVLTTFVLTMAALNPELLNSTTANLLNYLRSIFFIPYMKENGTLMPMLFVGWSLNYEMFFYLCVWFSIVTVRRHALWVTTGIVLVAYVAFGHFVDSLVLNRFLGNGLMFEFILGMVAFWVYEKRYLINVSTGVMVSAALVGYLCMAAVQANALHINRLLSYGVPSFLVICAAVSLERSIDSVPAVVRNMLVGAGDASYATYLSHPYVTQAMRKVADQKLHLIDINSLPGVVVTISIVLLIGGVIYLSIDKPLSRICKALLEKIFTRAEVNNGLSNRT